METRTSRSIKASPEGLKRLEEKRRMSGKTAEIIADLADLSRSSVQKFFKGEPISVENFRSLCEVLGLDWEEIADLKEIESSTSSRKRLAFVIEGSLDDLDPTKLAKLQAMVRVIQQLTGDASITTVDIEEGSIRLILEGSEEGIERLKQLFDAGELSEVLGTPVQAVELIESNVLDTDETREDHLKALLISTIRSQGALGANLINADLREADLSGANLTHANLSGVNLSNANLTNTDLSGTIFNNTLAYARALELTSNLANASAGARAFARGSTGTSTLKLDFANDLDFALNFALDFTSANDLANDLKLVRARANDLELDLANDLAHAFTYASAHNLTFALDHASTSALKLAADLSRIRTNLTHANFSGANLRNVDLSNIDLSSTNLSGAIVTNTYFGTGIGLTESEKRDLKRRGAIFDDSTRDREFILR